MSELKSQAISFLKQLQADICNELERHEGDKFFITDEWNREDESGGHGGGGITRILKEGNIFEQAGVNFSEVYGTLPVAMSSKLVGATTPQSFFATGMSLVFHPRSPLIPTTHANFRYLEVADKCWVGGGIDLTPYVLFKEDAVYFHQTLKNACDKFSDSYYQAFKKECDEYFYIKHRKETRGVGGLFFDYLGREEPQKIEHYFDFVKSVAQSFIPSYFPIVEKRKSGSFSERDKEFQLARRGRYVEFNLVYDRGTQFGLHTNGRTESILMSLPPIATWQYENNLALTEKEKELESILRDPIDWV